MRKLTGEGIPVPFYHAVLPLLGIDIGIPKLPFLPLTEDRIVQIKSGLMQTDVLDKWK